MGLLSSTRQPLTRCALSCTAAGRQRGRECGREGTGGDGSGGDGKGGEETVGEWRGGEGRGGEGRGGEGRGGEEGGEGRGGEGREGRGGEGRGGGKLHGRYPAERTGQYTVYSQTIPQRGPCP